MSFAYISSVTGGIIKIFVTQKNQLLLKEFIDEFIRLFPNKEIPQIYLDYGVKEYFRKTKRVQVVTIIMYFMSISTLSITVFIFYLIFDCWLKMTEIPLDLPFNASFPWDYHGNWTYPVLVALSFLGTLYTICTYIYVDAGFYAFCQQLLMHFQYICNTLQNYNTSADREHRFYPTFQGSKDDLLFLANIANYHIRLLR